jgi:hypothetical protein
MVAMGKFARSNRGAHARRLRSRVSVATMANTTCSICGLSGAICIPDGTAPECFVCIQTPFWDNQGKAVAETHLKRMGDIIHKCGKTAEVQLALPHDSRRAIAACLWSGFPWHGPDTGEDHMFGLPLLPEFVPSAHRATWHTVTMFHECLPWDEQIRRTAVFYVRHALRFGDYAMAAMSDEHMPRLPSGDAYVHFHVDGVSVVRSRGQRYDRDASSTIADRSRGL